MRGVSTFGDQGNSVFGTSGMSPDLMRSIRDDLYRENEMRQKGIGETLTNYVNRAELSHMESPEADRQFAEKLSGQVEDFFANIPLPEDPMKAALARTDEELEEEASMEMLKEAMREAYLRKMDAKKAEELRLRLAMKRLKEKGFEAPSEEARHWTPDADSVIDPKAVEKAVAEASAAREQQRSAGYCPPRKAPKERRELTFEEEMEAMAGDLDEGTLTDQLAEMQAKMKMMEALLDAKRKGRGSSGDH